MLWRQRFVTFESWETVHLMAMDINMTSGQGHSSKSTYIAWISPFTFRCFPLSQVVIHPKCFTFLFLGSTEARGGGICIHLTYRVTVVYFSIWPHQRMYSRVKVTHAQSNFKVVQRGIWLVNSRDDGNKRNKKLLQCRWSFRSTLWR